MKKLQLKSDVKTHDVEQSDRPLSIGRKDGSDVPVQDRSVSRQHAELAYRKGDGWYLRDLGSRFGTQVNGIPISAPIRLNEGDHITLGKVKFTVSMAASLDDTGFDTTGMAAAVAAPAPPARAPFPPPPSLPQAPGHDTNPVGRVADPSRQSRKRIVRIPVVNADSTVKTVAVLVFATVLLIVVAVLLKDRNGKPINRGPAVAKAPGDMGDPVTPVTPVAPVPVAPAPANPQPAAGAATGIMPPAAAAGAMPPAAPPPPKTVKVIRPTMPDGDLEAEKAQEAAAANGGLAGMPKAGGAAAVPPPIVVVPGTKLLQKHLGAQVQAGASLFWDVTLGQRTTRWTITSADDTGMIMKSPTARMLLPWDKLGNEGLYGLCEALVPGAQPPVLAAWLRLGAALGRSNEESYKKRLAELRDKDPEAAKEFDNPAPTLPPAAPAPTEGAIPVSVKAPDTPVPPPASPTPPKPVTPPTPPPPALPPAPAGWGKAAPALAPKLLMVARVGGPGDQWIKTVAVKGNIVAAAGEGDFQLAATVGADGTVKATPRGNLLARHSPWASLPPSTRGRTGSVEFGHRQVHPILQQPYLNGSAWKLWGWTYNQARASKAPYAPFVADSGIRHVSKMPNGSLFVVGMSDGGNTSLRAHPKDIDKALEFPIATGGGAGRSSYLFEVSANGDPLRQMVVRGAANAACWDTWGRILVVGRGILRGEPNAFDYPDGAGILMADAAWSRILFGTSIGAQGDGQCTLVGVSVDPTSGLAAACGFVSGEIKQVQGFQPKPGGGKDGLLVIFRLWTPGK